MLIFSIFQDYLKLNYAPAQEFHWNVNVLSAKILAHVLSKTIICASSIVTSVKMVMKKEMNCLDARNLESVNPLAIVLPAKKLFD